MGGVPDSVKRQIADPRPDVETFVAVITGRRKPDRVHLAELFADQEIMQWVTENVFATTWVPVSEDRRQQQEHLRCEIDYWHRMGYDYIRVSGGIEFPSHALTAADTAELAHERRRWTNGHSGPIQSWDDFHQYPWPVVKDEDLWMYHFVAENLPEGMGLFICPSGGFLEMPVNALVGYESLAVMIYDEPDLVRAVFDRAREVLVGMYRRLVDIPAVVGFFQGDDMGYKSGTLFSPEFLKSHSLVGHKELVDLAHSRDKIYMMHACGNLEAIMDYLIDEIGIDAKHSYEDVIMPVEDCYDRWGGRIGILGGVDVDVLARADQQMVRERTRKVIEHCAPGGRFALGSGNTIANYCKPENVLAMFDEAFRWRG